MPRIGRCCVSGFSPLGAPPCICCGSQLAYPSALPAFRSRSSRQWRLCRRPSFLGLARAQGVGGDGRVLRERRRLGRGGRQGLRRLPRGGEASRTPGGGGGGAHLLLGGRAARQSGGPASGGRAVRRSGGRAVGRSSRRRSIDLGCDVSTPWGRKQGLQLVRSPLANFGHIGRAARSSPCKFA